MCVCYTVYKLFPAPSWKKSNKLYYYGYLLKLLWHVIYMLLLNFTVVFTYRNSLTYDLSEVLTGVSVKHYNITVILVRANTFKGTVLSLLPW